MTYLKKRTFFEKQWEIKIVYSLIYELNFVNELTVSVGTNPSLRYRVYILLRTPQ